LARARARLTEQKVGEFGQSVLQMLASTPPSERYLDRLVVKSAGATHFLRVAEIDWIEGAGVYVNLHVAGKVVLYRATLNKLAARLDPARFIRVHRSAIINIDSIVRLEPVSHGEFDVILKHGGQTRVSRTYRFALEQRLGQPL
jgi:two-component system LytT family response regulator